MVDPGPEAEGTRVHLRWVMASPAGGGPDGLDSIAREKRSALARLAGLLDAAPAQTAAQEAGS
jgi:hypothetical protein